MAIYRVWSGGDGTGGANNTNWAQAYTTLTAALAVPPTAGDKIYISHVTQEATGGATTWNVPTSVIVISVNKDSSEAPTAMGTGGWLGTSTLSNPHSLYTGKYGYVYGVTIRSGGASNATLSFGSSTTGSQALFDDCYLWNGSSGASSVVSIGPDATDIAGSFEFRNLTIRVSSTGTTIQAQGQLFWNGGALSSSGSVPTNMFSSANLDPGATNILISGVDLTHASGTIINGAGYGNFGHEFRFHQCKISSSATPLSSVTSATKGSVKAWFVDCSNNAGTPDRGIWGYYDGLGSVIRETGIYRTDGATGWCWKAVGASAACYETPFVTPWVEYNNTVNTSITPRFEIFRDANTTAYTDAQVWAEWAHKNTSGSDQATFSFGDRQAFTDFLAGTAGASQAAGSGFGDWATGNSADWSGKVDSGSAITCAEDGVLRGRVAVVGAITVYIDPQIRT